MERLLNCEPSLTIFLMKTLPSLYKSIRTLLAFIIVFSYAQVYSQVIIPVEKEEIVDTFSSLAFDNGLLVINEILGGLSLPLLQLSFLLILAMVYAHRKRSALSKVRIYFSINPKLMAEIGLPSQGLL